MLSYARSFHQFLIQQAFYPLVLSSILALSFYTGRVFFGRSWNYSNLVWNLFLAWVPYIISLFVLASSRAFPRAWWLLPIPGAVWLLFYPNAAYIVTDFQHLYERPPIPLWYDIGLLATFAWTGCFLAIASLRSMQFIVWRYLGKWISWIFAGGVLLLSGVGIYLGRVGRWNSWDILFHPKSILKDVLLRVINPFNNLRFFAFTLMFTAFLVVSYLMFVSLTRFDEAEKSTPPRA